jgi:cyclohexanecarboxylate-CoA ligase
MGNTGQWADVRPAADLARRYRERGFWRDATPAADLRRWARETPDAVAVAEYRAGSWMHRMTYREYADRVDRVTAVLGELGVGQGNVVTVQLPNWWQLSAVVLACARLGAIAAPVVTTIRARELELMMSRLEPVAYVTTPAWDGYEHSAALAAIADRLPSVKHRVIAGDGAGPGEIDLARRMEEADPGRAGEGLPAEDPDRVSMVLFTSGTTGHPKAALHSFNTLYAGYATMAVRGGLSSADVLYTPHSVGHVVDALRQHPDIDDAALVGYGPKSELACAVVVSSKPLTLEEVRGYLDGIGMTDWYQPTRLELVDQLPRNPTGKVDKYHLRSWLSGR